MDTVELPESVSDTGNEPERQQTADETRDEPSHMLKVSARSRPSSVAGAIAAVVRESGTVSVQAIGAGAVNQAIKSIAIARSYLSLDGLDVVCIPSFADVVIRDESRTALRLIIERR